jgi:hypothetical protein
LNRWRHSETPLTYDRVGCSPPRAPCALILESSVLDVVEHFHRDAHQGRPLALRFRRTRSRRLLSPSRQSAALASFTTPAPSQKRQRSVTGRHPPAPQPGFLGATTIGTRHHDGISPGWSPLTRSALNWNSPKHFLSHPRHLHQKRGRGRDTPLCCAATNECRDATQEAVSEHSIRQDWRGDLEQSDARGGRRSGNDQKFVRRACASQVKGLRQIFDAQYSISLCGTKRSRRFGLELDSNPRQKALHTHPPLWSQGRDTHQKLQAK